LAEDSTRTEISELSSLGLVQMTRKRTRESLEHILCVTCPTCLRRGSIKSFATVMYDLFRGIQRAAQFYPWEGILISTSPKLVDYIQAHGAMRIKELSVAIGKPIELNASERYSEEHYDILPLSTRKG
jgi:ribonuclease G